MTTKKGVRRHLVAPSNVPASKLHTLSPVQATPVELLAIIFDYAFDDVNHKNGAVFFIVHVRSQ